MKLSVCIVPRWKGGPDDHWYPWVARELRARDAGPVRRLSLPGREEPTLEAWRAVLSKAVPEAMLERTVFVGHSVGCQAILRFLATLPEGRRARGVLAVAGWWAIDDPWESIRPWMEVPFDVARAREAAGEVVALLSDDDPFTRDQRENQRLWEARLGADVRLLSGRGHFTADEEPDVLDALLETFG